MEKMLWKRRCARRIRPRLIEHEVAEDLGGLEGIQCKMEKVIIA